jgi:ubiquinone/menaquinone biosynthesis C-methylase UbiE
VGAMTIADQQKAQQREAWSVAAPAWERNDEWLEETMGALSRWLVTATKLAPGMRVLDLACGAGEPAVSAARAVAPSGRVVATDLSPAMVEASQRRFDRLGLPIEARVMDAETIDFPDATFDAVTMRFGMMFCPDPARVAREIHRVLKPGGRFALSVWDQPQFNSFFTAIAQVAAKYIQLPPPDPTAPGPFRLAAPGALESTLRAGGFTEISIEPFPVVMRYASPERYWELQTELAAPIRSAISTLAPEELAKLRAAVIEVGIANTVGDEVRFNAQPLTATGVR